MGHIQSFLCTDRSGRSLLYDTDFCIAFTSLESWSFTSTKHLNTHPQHAHILPENLTNYFDYQKVDGLDEGPCGIRTIHFWVIPLSSAPKTFLLSSAICHDHDAKEATLKLNSHLIPKWDWRWAQEKGKTGMWATSSWLNRRVTSEPTNFNPTSVEKGISSDHIHEKCHPRNNHSRIFSLSLLFSSSLPLAWKLSIPRAISSFSKKYHESGGSNSLKQILIKDII